MFSVWSNSSNKAKKIEVVMNQIKSTKRLTFDDFQAFTSFAVGYYVRKKCSIHENGGCQHTFEQK